MFKTFAAAAAISVLCSAATAAVIDAFALDVTSAAGTDSSVVLNAGETYRLTVSGTILIGSNPTRHVADAEYFNLGGPSPAPIDGTSTEIGVGVDGADIDFGAFNPTNVYSALIVGDGTTINVFFSDSAYGDNSGSLAVEIATVPLPAGMALMLSGLAGLGLARRRKT